MKVKWIVGILLLAVTLYFVVPQSDDNSRAGGLARTEESSVTPDVQEGEEMETLSSDSKHQEPTADLNQENVSPLHKLLKRVDGLSMFNQKGLDVLRAEAYEWIEKNPKEFEDFTLNQVRDADKNSIESMFFFVEAYAKKHPDPSEGINEILKLKAESKKQDHVHGKMGEVQKQNMTKAFVLEIYFDRLDENSSGPSEGIAQIEKTVKNIVESDDDLMMVRQGLQVLRNSLDYDNEKLKEIIESRPNSANEGHAVSDILGE